MGQSSSSVCSDTKAHDLASSFENFFKDYKMESKILSPETITLIKSNLEKGDVQGAASVISEALKDIENAPLHIAVTGESGSGKSSFINALRGIGHEEVDAANVGVVETTSEKAGYKHPKFPKVTIWDLPGIGTTKFQPRKYLKEMEFNTYDFFFIICATRFKENDLELAKAIKKMKKNFYFVRAKVDSDLYNKKMSHPNTFCKDKVLEEIRDDCLKHLQEAKLEDPRVFLISNLNKFAYDFPNLETTLLKELPAHKRYIFMQCLPSVTDAAIDRKRDFLKQKIWLEALKAGTTATIPFMGFISDNDMEKLEKTLTVYRSYFGLDDASLENMAKKWDLSVEELKAKIKSPHLLLVETDDEKLGEKLLKFVEKVCSISGGLLATGLYFRKTFYLQNYFLDTVVNDAKVLLSKELIKDLVGLDRPNCF
ncbi:interferon-gamma-inducible GTPase 10-like isoform 1-T2 [Trichechus inunguis]|uniref:T-cell-specific guanine nucleotide triphosphate-binding protein 1-like n=1 Tax=Trichechus manatus latirostris TaxID=127582 RepID=A0A2Y9E5C0_TRIMA|nr:T-cell-specific guanine nucleotide triphosphate-binding protein 1-like [Trichechus manatus latirostris]